jgi:hypothetical protein
LRRYPKHILSSEVIFTQRRAACLTD